MQVKETTGCVKWIDDYHQCGAADTTACFYCGLPVCSAHARTNAAGRVCCPRNHN